MNDVTDTEAIEKRLVWIIGSPRTGSTWLLRLLCYPWGVGRTATGIDPSRFRPRGGNVVPVNESYLGHHLGPLRDPLPPPESAAAASLLLNDTRRGDPAYFFSDEYRDAWREPLRRLALERFGAQVERARAEHGIVDPLVLIKEPNGSHAADLIADLLPALADDLPAPRRSRRGRLDDGSRLGGRLADPDRGRQPAADTRAAPAGCPPPGQPLVGPDDRHGARLPRLGAGGLAAGPLRGPARRHRERAQPPRRLARPEPERAPDPRRRTGNRFGSLRNRLRGRRKGVRAASPGLWRENLSASEQRAIAEIIGPKLRELGYEA